MLDDILSKDLDKAISNTIETQNIINRIYYSENLLKYFRKTFVSLIATALSFTLNNLKIMKIQYTAKLAGKEE